MPLNKKLQRKIEKYKRRIRRLKRKRSRTRSRSPISISDEPLQDPPSLIPDTDEDNSDTDIDKEPAVTQQEDSEIIPDQIIAFKEALGAEYEDTKKFENNIHPEIGKRWTHILLNGISKEEKEEICKIYKLPQNCTLLEAPVLNDEVKCIISENSKTRDRSIEHTQHQLGLATSIIGQVMTNIINDKVNTIEIVKNLTDASKLLNDIHFQNSRTRRILISPLLDKSFNSLIDKVKRDENLYGTDLASKIKTSQDLKKSSSQIKKIIPKPVPVKTTPASVSKTPANKLSGNRYGPSQPLQAQQTRPTANRGGPRIRAAQPIPPSFRPTPHRSRPERAVPGPYSRR